MIRLSTLLATLENTFSVEKNANDAVNQIYIHIFSLDLGAVFGP